MTSSAGSNKTGLELAPLPNIIQELMNRYDNESRAMILAFDHIDNPEDPGDHRIIIVGETHRTIHLQSAINNSLLVKWLEQQGLIISRR